MSSSSTSSTRPDGPRWGLTDDLITLAGMPDDESAVPALLRSVVQLAADLLAPVSYASVTVLENASYATVAMSSQAALAVDQAQYADGSGPCLDALQTSEPTSVPRIDRTVRWPHFRATALRLGLCASLSVPLFAGRGRTIAALNLYGHDVQAMAPLSGAVLTAFDDPDAKSAARGRDGLAPGSRELVDGLIGAFGVRTRIQRALGVIMGTENVDADVAYTILRSDAAGASRSLAAEADSVLADIGDQPKSA